MTMISSFVGATDSFFSKEDEDAVEDDDEETTVAGADESVAFWSEL